MRVELAEEAMYKRMDRKDRAKILIPVSGGILFLGVVLLAEGVSSAVWAGMLLTGAAGVLWNMSVYFQMKRLVMPTSGCFLEVEDTCFSFIQPYQDGIYEKGRIYLNEAEELIDDGKKGGFYLRFRKDGKSLVDDGSGKARNVVYIAPFGYEKDQMDDIYMTLYDLLPESAGVYEKER